MAEFTIGQVAAETGLRTSAIRGYESQRLIPTARIIAAPEMG